MSEQLPDPAFARRAASLLRAAANDLKRDEASADHDLGLEPGTFADLVEGKLPITWEVLRTAARVWPLNERDLLPVRDDCPDGVLIHREKASRASSRILARSGVDYYEYRDTAMARAASYRPEWIKMLQAVEDNDPLNPRVQWNRGHLLYQFTYFVGPVNYYYSWGDERHCVPMETGDSVWGLPFAPHSFTARSGEGEAQAHILALTYGGSLVGDAQRELAVLGREAAHELALPSADPAAARAQLLASRLEARAMTVTEAADRARLAPARARELFEGAAEPTPEELSALAAALGVAVCDIQPRHTDTDKGVLLRRAAATRRWLYPDAGAPAYRVRELASDPLHPDTSSLELDVLARQEESTALLTTHQHQYAYVLGNEPVRLIWHSHGRCHDEELSPGDSLYAGPRVPLAFFTDTETNTSTCPRLLLLRIGGAVTTDVRFGLDAMAHGGIDRYIAEDGLWYAKERESQ